MTLHIHKWTDTGYSNVEECMVVGCTAARSGDVIVPYACAVISQRAAAMGSVEHAIDSLRLVMNVHENHIYPDDTEAFTRSIERLERMREDGFE